MATAHLLETREMTGADALVEGLLAQGLTTLFALPGAQIDHLFCAIYDRDDAPELITSRHEQGAAYMAFGAARSTGEPAAFAVVPGPGWLNASAALATAYGCNAPVLSLCGQIPSGSIGKGIGELHELPDQLAMARGITKWARRANSPAEAPTLMAEAFAQLRSGRPRPVHLEMAPDIMGARAQIAAPAVSKPSATPPDQHSIESAARTIAAAERPLIMVGSGAQAAAMEVRELSRRLQAPVSAMRSGRGVQDERSWLFQPFAAAHHLWRDADVVVAIGTRLDFPRRMWGEDSRLKVIRIDIDPEEFGRISSPHIAVHADAALAVRALLDALPSALRASREQELRALREVTETGFDTAMRPQMDFLRAIRSALPEDGFFVDELTQVGYASWSWFPTSQPRHYISSGYQGTLGYGFPTSLGVKAANRSSAVVSVSGDGGFLFACQELATAAKFDLGVVSIVFRDNKFGNVQRIQRERYNGKVIGSDLHNPDFVELARSFGVAASRSTSAAELQDQVARAIAAGGPHLIEVPVGDLPSPWTSVVLPRVRG